MTHQSKAALTSLLLACVLAIAAAQPAAAAREHVTVTYNLAVQSSEGMDGALAWESVFLLDDGRIVEWGTGNHVREQNNGIRYFDPYHDQTGYIWPWTQDISPPDWHKGHDLYVDNYDNQPQMYIPDDEVLVWAGHGIFDLKQKRWIYGNRPPFGPNQRWDKYVAGDRRFGRTLNPGTAWCRDLHLGVWFGGGTGGGAGPGDVLATIEHNPDYPKRSSAPWRLYRKHMAPEGVRELARLRNSAACVGRYFYQTAGTYLDKDDKVAINREFYKIDMVTKTLVAKLAPMPETVTGAYPSLVYDSKRNLFVLISNQIWTYDPSSNTWSNVTPEKWDYWDYVHAVYHPDLDAIFFRGGYTRTHYHDLPLHAWHKIAFRPKSSS